MMPAITRSRDRPGCRSSWPLFVAAPAGFRQIRSTARTFSFAAPDMFVVIEVLPTTRGIFADCLHSLRPAFELMHTSVQAGGIFKSRIRDRGQHEPASSRQRALIAKALSAIRTG